METKSRSNEKVIQRRQVNVNHLKCYEKKPTDVLNFYVHLHLFNVTAVKAKNYHIKLT